MKLHVHADPEHLTATHLICDVQIKYCYINCWNILYIICYYMCWFFKVTMILSKLIKVASFIQALYMHVLFRQITMNLSFVCLFFMVKREHNAVPKFFKMFSIFQMMFIKEVILIQWEFSMLRSRVERRGHSSKKKYKRWQPPFVLLKDIS